MYTDSATKFIAAHTQGTRMYEHLNVGQEVKSLSRPCIQGAILLLWTNIVWTYLWPQIPADLWL